MFLWGCWIWRNAPLFLMGFFTFAQRAGRRCPESDICNSYTTSYMVRFAVGCLVRLGYCWNIKEMILFSEAILHWTLFQVDGDCHVTVGEGCTPKESFRTEWKSEQKDPSWGAHSVKLSKVIMGNTSIEWIFGTVGNLLINEATGVGFYCNSHSRSNGRWCDCTWRKITTYQIRMYTSIHFAYIVQRFVRISPRYMYL